MAELVDQGKVRWAGVSNFDVELLDRCEAIRHVDSVQPPLNLLNRAAATDVVTWCREHGTTLAGLMKEEGVNPHHFLADVHDISLDRVTADDRLARLLPLLPGRRFVFTNGDAPYARRVLQAIGVNEHFHEIHDIHASSYRAKPDPHGYELLCERLGIDPVHALLADDMARNLVPAKELGMTTVWVDNGSERGDDGYDAAMIDYRITDVADWLASILGEAE